MTAITVESEYMTFERHEIPGRKTPIIVVRNKRSGDKLGEVRWHGPWHQFVFAPVSGCIFNVGCMDDIIKVIIELKKERARA